MKIKLEGTGDLKNYMGEDQTAIELEDHAVIADLLPIIEEKWGSAFPAHYWNWKKHRFRGPVVVVVNDVPVRGMDAQLNEGDHVQLVKALVGG